MSLQEQKPSSLCLSLSLPLLVLCSVSCQCSTINLGEAGCIQLDEGTSRRGRPKVRGSIPTGGEATPPLFWSSPCAWARLQPAPDHSNIVTTGTRACITCYSNGLVTCRCLGLACQPWHIEVCLCMVLCVSGGCPQNPPPPPKKKCSSLTPPMHCLWLPGHDGLGLM
jgi:hypothetical protein